MSGILSIPLKPDHWIFNLADWKPPAPYLTGKRDFVQVNAPRVSVEADVRMALQWALQSASMSGRVDPDPDAIIQNAIVALFGFHTEDGTRNTPVVR